MLANIKYAMRKNKSTPITMRALNLSCMLNDGDVVDSKNVSLRKYPYITTGKQDKVEIDSGTVGSMAVFKDELVTKEQELQFAAINTKLTMFPRRTYQEEDGMVKNLFCSSESNFTVFSSNSIVQLSVGENATVISGYGGTASKNEFRVLGNEDFNNGYNIAIGVTRDSHVKLCGICGPTIEVWPSGLSLKSEVAPGQILYIKYDDEKYKHYTNFYKVKSVQDNSYQDGSISYTVITPELEFLDAPGNVVAMPTGANPTVYKIQYLEGFNPLSYRVGEAISFNEKSPCILRDEMDVGVFCLDDPELVLDCSIYSTPKLIRWNYNFEILSPGNTVTVIIPEAHFVVKGKLSGAETFCLYFENDITDGRTYISSSPIYGKAYVIVGDCETQTPEFKKGDVVSVGVYQSESAGTLLIDTNNPNNTSFKIDNIDNGMIYAALDLFKPGVETKQVEISRDIPYLDFVCEKDNRLYGCSNADKTIYVSALGDPTNMFDYDGISTDSFAVAVGSDGDFTGCCKYGSSVLFFKENKIYKLMGSYPAEYSLYSYDVDGVEAGSENSIVTINEVLYYKAKRGIFAYTGDVPTLISSCFGDKRFHSAAAGTDGESYFVSMKDDKDQSYLFSYNPRLGIWMMEGNDDISQFVRQGNDVKALSHGNVYNFRSVEDPNVEWHLQFAPIYETMEGKKIYSRIMMRAEIPRGSYMKIKIRCDGGAWLEAGTVVGKMADVVPIMIPINRCDKFELRLEGKGPCTILSMQREFYVSGSNK
jgi:hypothetical protein